MTGSFGRRLALIGALVAGGCTAGGGGHSSPAATGAPSSRTGTTGPLASASSLAPTSVVTTAPCSDQSVLRSWPVARRAAQLVVVPVAGADPGAVAVAVSSGAGGILLLGAVPSGPQLVTALKPALSPEPVGRPLVMVDQEGGGVQRLGADVSAMPWPRQMASTMTPAEVQALAAREGRQMAALGVNVDLAPVLDLDSGAALSATDPDGPRSFSANPSVAAAYGTAFAAGLRSAGVLAVAKHFPGLGGSTGNTDYGPAATRPLSELETAGLLPFERATAGATVTAVMVANATVPGLSSLPASLSAPVVTGLLRDRLHFGGLVLTDSLSAGAVKAAGYGEASAAVASIEAGADMVLFGSTLTASDRAALQPGPLRERTAATVAAIEAAVASGSLPEGRLDDAVLHVMEAKAVSLCPAPPG